jgi:hypothetical protein
LQNDNHNAAVHQLSDRCASFILDNTGDSITNNNELTVLVNAWIDFYIGESSETSCNLVLDQIYNQLPCDDPNKLWEIIKALLSSNLYSEKLQVGNLVSELLDVCCIKYSKIVSNEMISNRKLAEAIVSFGTDVRPEWNQLFSEAKLLLRTQNY